MNQIHLNEFGAADLLAGNLRKIEALASASHYLLKSVDASVYLQDAAELMELIRSLVTSSESLCTELMAHIQQRASTVPGGER